MRSSRLVIAKAPHLVVARDPRLVIAKALHLVIARAPHLVIARSEATWQSSSFHTERSDAVFLAVEWTGGVSLFFPLFYSAALRRR
jgi:hypothetical protein